MAVITYRENASAPWQELAMVGDVIKGDSSAACVYPDIWYNGQINSNTQPVQRYVFDVTNAKSFTFTYDFNTSSNSNYIAKCSLDVNYGYTLQDSKANTLPVPTLLLVDTGAYYTTVFEDLSTDIIGNTVTLDVSAYTSIILSFQTVFDVTKQADIQYGYVHLYNIKTN